MGKIYVEIQGGQVTPLPLPGGAHAHGQLCNSRSPISLCVRDSREQSLLADTVRLGADEPAHLVHSVQCVRSPPALRATVDEQPAEQRFGQEARVGVELDVGGGAESLVQLLVDVRQTDTRRQALSQHLHADSRRHVQYAYRTRLTEYLTTIL